MRRFLSRGYFNKKKTEVKEESKRLTEEEYQALVKKIESTFPLRMALAKLAELKTKKLIDFDMTVLELFTFIQIHQPQNVDRARSLIVKHRQDDLMAPIVPPVVAKTSSKQQ